MSVTEDGELGITGDELADVVEGLECGVGVKTSLRRLVAGFSNPRSFLAASDAELKRRCRYGARMEELVKAVRERCYYLETHKEERFRLNRSFAKMLDERDRRMALELERRNPVFTPNDLQVAVLFMGEMKLECIDLLRLNQMRDSLTAAHRVEMRKRREDAEAERIRREEAELESLRKRRAEIAPLVAEELARIESEREEKAKQERERQEKGARNGRK